MRRRDCILTARNIQNRRRDTTSAGLTQLQFAPHEEDLVYDAETANIHRQRK